MDCFDCGEGPCDMNCAPWCPPNQLYHGRHGDNCITEDGNGIYRVFKIGGECLAMFGTKEKAIEFLEKDNG